MTMTEFDRIFVVVKEQLYFINHKIVVNVFRTYSATYSTISCLFRPAFLNKLPPFLNKQPKNVVSLQKKSSTRQFESKLSLRSFAFSLQKKSCISAKYLSKLNILHSICIFFTPSTNECAQGASQEASITTKGGHNRRQAPVIY